MSGQIIGKSNGAEIVVCERLRGILWGGAVFVISLFASDEALAYEQFRVNEGEWKTVKIDLPSYPHEARRFSNAGYDGVRYSLCLSDGSATGIDWSSISPYLFNQGGNNIDWEGKDYIRVCGITATAKSNGRFTKWFNITSSSVNDNEKEGDEYYWVRLSNPEVKRPGSNVWESHSGSHHVPASIKIQFIIVDND